MLSVWIGNYGQRCEEARKEGGALGENGHVGKTKDIRGNVYLRLGQRRRGKGEKDGGRFEEAGVL